uniref:Uncharacterized protein n=1 Tax=viral metagenome TaxID=1070528 RepID=A0A6C0E7Q1_9ZZZZ
MGDQEKQGRAPKGRRPPQTRGVVYEKVGPSELGKADARMSYAEVAAAFAAKLAKATAADKAAFRKTQAYKDLMEEIRKEEEPIDMNMLGGSRCRGRSKKVTRRKRRHH